MVNIVKKFLSMISPVVKFVVPLLNKYAIAQTKQCRGVFGIKKLVEQEKQELTLEQVNTDYRDSAINLIKKYYLPEHVLVRDRNMDLTEDCAIDEYLTSLIRQGNTIHAKADNGKVVGICVGFACSPIDVTNLRAYAFYRQDPNTKDFMYFTAKLQETPNLWETFKQKKIFEIRMLAVLPEYRRQGIATSLVEFAMGQAHDQGFNVIRMNCINPYDFKVAERCMLSCIVKYPLHRLRGSNAPFVKRSSPNNCCVRVYCATRSQSDTPDLNQVREKKKEMEQFID